MDDELGLILACVFRCGDTFCSRECRVGMGAGGDGKKSVWRSDLPGEVATAGLLTYRYESLGGRHVCGLLETRLLSRAAQSPNGNLL